MNNLHFPDRLAQAVTRCGNALCVGLDPRWESLPKTIRDKHAGDGLIGAARAFEAFCVRVLELARGKAPVVKPQSAFFEACGPEGMQAQANVLRVASELGFVTILDAKRGDIASTATAYADAAFGGTRIAERVYPVWNADSLTVNPYLGLDSVEPFLKSAQADRRGMFVLVRTSNPGASLFQDVDCAGSKLYRRVAEAVNAWNEPTLGECGLGAVGAVVGATHPAELAELRRFMPNVWFLVPGYGAQGGSAEDVRVAFRSDGLGAVINSSRGVTFPFKPDDPDWESAISRAIDRATSELLMKAS